MFLRDFLEEINVCPICKGGNFSSMVSRFDGFDTYDSLSVETKGDFLVLKDMNNLKIDMTNNKVCLSEDKLNYMLYDLLEIDLNLEVQCLNCDLNKSPFSYTAKTNIMTFNQLTNCFSPTIVEQELVEVIFENKKAMLVNSEFQDGSLLVFFNENGKIDNMAFINMLPVRNINFSSASKVMQMFKNILILK